MSCSSISKRARAIAWLFTMVYFASYTMRINFAVMMVKICADMQVEKTQLAIVVTGLTVSYGVGQVISGLLGDRVKPQRLLSVGLLLACACNIVMSFSTAIPLMVAVWTVNGFAHALMWPPMVRMMSVNLSDAEYGLAAVRVSWGSQFATILLYVGCPLLLSFLPWRGVMLCCAALGGCLTLVWMLVHPRLIEERKHEGSITKSDPTPTEKIPLPRYVYIPVVLIILGIISQGTLRDGVTNWMPSYLLETFRLPEENAILATVILAVFGVFSFSVFDAIHRKLFRNEVLCAGMIFLLSTLAAGILYVVNLFSASVAISMLLMALIVGSMHGINLMLITVVPKRFVKSGRVATYSGLLNACTYIGAALSTYGFAALAERFGWNFTILTWVAVSLCGTLFCLFATPLWKRFRREYADD